MLFAFPLADSEDQELDPCCSISSVEKGDGMSDDRPIRIFVVDDHQVVRMGVKSMFESVPGFIVAGTAASGHDALEAIPGLEVDVVLTDLRMKEMSGDSLIAELAKICPKVRAAVLTNYHSDEEVFNAMKAGAMAYILKSATLEQIVAAIRSVHAGECSIPPHIAHQLAQRVTRSRLSVRELEILQLVAKGMKNKEIADQLSISENTVRNHMISLFEKLGCRDRTEATTVAIRQGLVKIEED
jgi:two-component system NarL family response regulator